MLLVRESRNLFAACPLLHLPHHSLPRRSTRTRMVTAPPTPFLQYFPTRKLGFTWVTPLEVTVHKNWSLSLCELFTGQNGSWSFYPSFVILKKKYN
jgi:hypothetical protein